MVRTGFICEHTAEFYIVPSLVRAFSRRGIRVLPIYYWATREGSRAAIAGNPDLSVQVAAIYARRPKVSQPGDQEILLKFNYTLFEAKEEGTRLGLPVYAAAPLASSLFDLRPQTPCAWFHLEAKTAAVEDAYCIVDMSTTPPAMRHGDMILPIEEDALLDRIQGEAPIRSWREWTSILSEFKRRIRRPHMFFGSLYKPFFVISLGG